MIALQLGTITRIENEVRTELTAGNTCGSNDPLTLSVSPIGKSDNGDEDDIEVHVEREMMRYRAMWDYKVCKM